MKILCLHGHGTSAAIFKSQTVAFRNKLDDSFEFEFVDAPFDCAPAPGVDYLFESGHFTWWPRPTVQAIRAAHLWLDDYLEANGPYDAVCGFSQGCLLLASYLLYHQREAAPGTPPPFRSAVFICGGVPYAVLEDLGLQVPQRAKDISERSGAALQRKAGVLADFAAHPERIKRGVGLWDDTADLQHDAGAPLPGPEDVFGLDYTSFPRDVFVKIPTVHIYGSKDPMWPSSLQLAHFCTNRTTFDHGGGHDIPRSTAVSVRIADLVRQVTAEAG